MQGYLVTFFTQRNRKHDGTSLAEWVIAQAKQLGVRGATLFSGQEGFGHDGHFHTNDYFDMQDQPLQVVMALTYDEFSRLFARIKQEGLHIFFTKAPIEFGFTDQPE